MSDEHLEIKATQFRPPCCPFCKRDLNEFREKTVVFKFGVVAHVFWCPSEDCRALLSMQIMGPAPIEAPQVQLPPPGFKVPSGGFNDH